MWHKLRSNKPTRAPFPPEWRQFVAALCPFYHQLPEPDRAELEGHVQIFLAGKKFEGCGGLNLTEKIKVSIAAHACLLLLHRDTDCYPRLRTVLVYPGTYFAPTLRHVGSGVMEESHQPRAGEAWREGSVVVAWDAVCSAIQAPENGNNVVWHEFAHLLDFEDGQADGVPLLGRGESWLVRKSRYSAWSRVMRSEFEQLRTQVQRGEGTVLRDYGATSPAEFFAVATECFFGRPHALPQQHPELYAQMRWYYQQDPVHWCAVQPRSVSAADD